MLHSQQLRCVGVGSVGCSQMGKASGPTCSLFGLGIEEQLATEGNELVIKFFLRNKVKKGRKGVLVYLLPHHTHTSSCGRYNIDHRAFVGRP